MIILVPWTICVIGRSDVSTFQHKPSNVARPESEVNVIGPKWRQSVISLAQLANWGEIACFLQKNLIPIIPQIGAKLPSEFDKIV